MIAKVDADLCIGCELCAGTVPDVFEMDGSVKIHHRNIQAMALEMFKVKNGTGTSITNNIFKICDEVDRSNTRFYNNSNGFYIPNTFQI